MQFDRRRFVGAALAASVAACTTRSVAPPQASLPTPLPPAVPQPLPAQVAAAEYPPLLQEALAALDFHSRLVAQRDRIMLVDFSQPSREPRMQLVDVAGGRIERTWLVSHGSGSDPAATGMLQHFSNEPGSNASSRGAYLTANPYYGKHGLSQRLIGLDPTNNMALDRAIVLHGADYVNPALIASQGRIGRSQGCFAVEQAEVATVMEVLGQGRMIYAGKIA